jgi:hypothetical protein
VGRGGGTSATGGADAGRGISATCGVSGSGGAASASNGACSSRTLAVPVNAGAGAATISRGSSGTGGAAALDAVAGASPSIKITSIAPSCRGAVGGATMDWVASTMTAARQP